MAESEHENRSKKYSHPSFQNRSNFQRPSYNRDNGPQHASYNRPPNRDNAHANMVLKHLGVTDLREHLNKMKEHSGPEFNKNDHQKHIQSQKGSYHLESHKDEYKSRSEFHRTGHNKNTELHKDDKHPDLYKNDQKHLDSNERKYPEPYKNNQKYPYRGHQGFSYRGRGNFRGGQRGSNEHDSYIRGPCNIQVELKTATGERTYKFDKSKKLADIKHVSDTDQENQRSFKNTKPEMQFLNKDVANAGGKRKSHFLKKPHFEQASKNISSRKENRNHKIKDVQVYEENWDEEIAHNEKLIEAQKDSIAGAQNKKIYTDSSQDSEDYKSFEINKPNTDEKSKDQSSLESVLPTFVKNTKLAEANETTLEESLLENLKEDQLENLEEGQFENLEKDLLEKSEEGQFKNLGEDCLENCNSEENNSESDDEEKKKLHLKTQNNRKQISEHEAELCDNNSNNV